MLRACKMNLIRTVGGRRWIGAGVEATDASADGGTGVEEKARAQLPPLPEDRTLRVTMKPDGLHGIESEGRRGMLARPPGCLKGGELAWHRHGCHGSIAFCLCCL